jgi:hypothetical protein
MLPKITITVRYLLQDTTKGIILLNSTLEGTGVGIEVGRTVVGLGMCLSMVVNKCNGVVEVVDEEGGIMRFQSGRKRNM